MFQTNAHLHHVVTDLALDISMMLPLPMSWELLDGSPKGLSTLTKISPSPMGDQNFQGFVSQAFRNLY